MVAGAGGAWAHRTPAISGAASEGAGGESNLEVDYYIQDRSSIPVREAYVRQT